MKRRDILCSLPAVALAGVGASGEFVMHANDSIIEIGRWLVSNNILPTDFALLSAGLKCDAIDASARDAVQADFSAGRIISVDGWFISETEARLCALAAIQAGYGATA